MPLTKGVVKPLRGQERCDAVRPDGRRATEVIHFRFLIRVEVTCYHRVETSLFAELELLMQELVEEELCFSFRRKG